MLASELRKKFLEFFKARGHAVAPSSSLIPDDPSVLLTTAGMQQFKKYYTGEADPIKDFGSKNTTSIQKSFRTSDIDEVGDDSHLTFFEMLGNFSFGGYFKEKSIEYGFEFIKSLGVNVDYVTIFDPKKVPKGDWREGVPFDTESYEIWKKFVPENKIRREGIDNFWGPTGNEGPCGPTTEIYVNGVEVWNIVFNQFFCDKNKNLKPLKIQGVDTGMGLERLAMVSQNKKNIFETDLFAPYLELLPKEIAEKTKRIIIDHLRGSVFLLADGVRPSNKEAGYVLRRLMRRIFVYEYQAKLPEHLLDGILHDIVHEYGEFYPELLENAEEIRKEVNGERERFGNTLKEGLKELERRYPLIEAQIRKIGEQSAYKVWERHVGKEAADLYQTFGLSIEIIREHLKNNRYEFDEKEFNEAVKEVFQKHQEISRAGIEKKFGGHGLLLDTGELKAANEEELNKVTRLHTATHLLQASLRKVLGDSIKQAGSDITAERTRFDFNFERKLTDEEIKRIEDLVNFAISQKYHVDMKEMPYKEAQKLGALHFFKEKYPEMVKVYSIGNFKADPPEIFSRELCGGPHVKNTADIGHFKITKQEAVGAGSRRIRATVE